MTTDIERAFSIQIIMGNEKKVRELATREPALLRSVQLPLYVKELRNSVASSAVHLALSDSGKPIIMAALHELGAPANLPNQQGQTPMAYAFSIALGKKQEKPAQMYDTLRTLLCMADPYEVGGDPAINERFVNLAFSPEIMRNNPWFAQAMLDHGIDQDSVGKEGMTPLMSTITKFGAAEQGSYIDLQTLAPYFIDLARRGLKFAPLLGKNLGDLPEVQNAIQGQSATQPQTASTVAGRLGGYLARRRAQTQVQKGGLEEQLPILNRGIAAIATEADKVRERLFKSGPPTVDALIDKGRIRPDAQLLLSAHGVEAFFDTSSWAGHEQQAVQVYTALKSAVSPYWRHELETRANLAAITGRANLPGEEVSIALMATASGQARHV